MAAFAFVRNVGTYYYLPTHSINSITHQHTTHQTVTHIGLLFHRLYQSGRVITPPLSTNRLPVDNYLPLSSPLLNIWIID